MPEQVAWAILKVNATFRKDAGILGKPDLLSLSVNSSAYPPIVSAAALRWMDRSMNARRAHSPICADICRPPHQLVEGRNLDWPDRKVRDALRIAFRTCTLRGAMAEHLR